MATLAPPPIETVLKEVQDWDYQDQNAFLAPYGRFNAVSYPEDFLVGLYFRARDQKLLPTVMPGISDHSLSAFISLFHGKPLLVGLAKPKYDVAAVAWTWGVEGQDGARKGSLGFLFYREYWATPAVRSLARLALRWWFVNDKIDVLYGTTLKANHLAKNFAKKLGFKVLTDLPGFFTVQGALVDATLVVQLKEEFLAREVQRCAG